MASQLKRQRRTQAEVEAVREAAREELAIGHPMTLRQVHYRLVSRDDVIQPNTLSAYDTLSGWLRDDRLSGAVPWHWMEDRLRKANSWRGWQDPSDWVRDVRRGYYRDPWQDQDDYLEVWVEKDALSGIFGTELGPYRVVYNIGRGYDGWSSINQAATRYTDRADEGIETTVLYFGDFDPSGEDMHRSLQDRLAVLGAFPNMPKVALTAEDAQRLPGDVTKAGDSRAAAFVAKYGDLAVELDALPVGELRKRIRAAVEEHIDLDALTESKRLEQKHRQKVAEGMDRIFSNG